MNSYRFTITIGTKVLAEVSKLKYAKKLIKRKDINKFDVKVIDNKLNKIANIF